MISHDYKAIYLHIGKTGGVSIERMLIDEERDANITNRDIMFGYDKGEGIYLQHATAAMTRQLVGDKMFDEYYKFALVRNPYSRMLSAYHYLYKQHEKRFGSFAGYIKALPDIVNKPQVQKASHHIPQTFYTHIDGVQVCDYVGKFEDLPLSIEPVRAHLNIENKLEKHNASRRVNWSRRSAASYYSKPMQQIMKEVFASDFEAYQYSTDPKDIPHDFWKANLKAAKIVSKPYVNKGRRLAKRLKNKLR